MSIYSILSIIIIATVAIGYYIWMKRSGGSESGEKSSMMPSFGKSKGKKGATPILDSYSRDLTAQAAAGQLDPVINRENEIERVTAILSRRRKNNPVLLGPAGVGKTAIVEGLAQRIVDKRVPSSLQSKRVLALNVSSLIAGTKYRGEFEQRLRKVMDELALSERNIILFIDEVHLIVESKGAEGALDPSDILKPALARGDLQAIGATTLQDYEKFFKTDESLERRFQPVMVNPPDIKMTIEILKGIKQVYENHHQVTIPDETLRKAAIFADKYIKERYLPDKAIDLIDEGAAKVRLEAISAQDQIIKLEEKNKTLKTELEKNPSPELQDQYNQNDIKIKKFQARAAEAENGQLPVVTEEDMREIISEWANVPITDVVMDDQTQQS